MNTITIKFFASLKEHLGCESIQLEVSAQSLSIAQIKLLIIAQNPQWQTAIENNKVLSAVNHDMVDANHLVKIGDEVAFFPPVTGG